LEGKSVGVGEGQVGGGDRRTESCCVVTEASSGKGSTETAVTAETVEMGLEADEASALDGEETGKECSETGSSSEDDA